MASISTPALITNPALNPSKNFLSAILTVSSKLKDRDITNLDIIDKNTRLILSDYVKSCLKLWTSIKSYIGIRL